MLSEVVMYRSVFQSFINTLADLISVLMRLNLLLLLCVSMIHISAPNCKLPPTNQNEKKTTVISELFRFKLFFEHFLFSQQLTFCEE